MDPQLEGLEDLEVVPKDRSGGIGLLYRRGVSLDVEKIAHSVIGCAIEVHRELGPGLLERIYEDALVYELTTAGLKVERQCDIVIPYKTIELRGQRLDLRVEGCVIVELKSVTDIAEIHKAVLLSYLRAANVPLGILLNFNVSLLRDGLRRVVNDRFRPNVLPSSPSNPSSPSS